MDSLPATKHLRATLRTVSIVGVIGALILGAVWPWIGEAQASVPEASNVRWVTPGSGIPNQSEAASLSMPSPDGARVFVAGTGGKDILTTAYGSGSGERLWSARYDGPANGRDSAQSMQMSPDGSRIFVSGRSEETPGDYALVTVAYDAASGQELWAARFNDGTRSDTARNMAVSPDGSRIYVLGMSGRDLLTVVYAASSGTELGVFWHLASSESYVDGNSVFISPDGTRIYIVGTSRAKTGFEESYFTMAISATTGAQLWTARFDGPYANEWAKAAVLSPDGTRLFVTGESEGPLPRGFDAFVTLAYDTSTGTPLWEGRYGGTFDSDFAQSIAVSPDGSQVFVTGGSAHAHDIVSESTLVIGQRSYSSLFDFATVAYTASTGEQRWVARYNGPADDYDSPSKVAVSPDNKRVYVTGSVTVRSPLDQSGCGIFGTPPCWWGINDANLWDAATVAYSASSGTELWAATYDGGFDRYDRGYSLSISPDSSQIYVAGVSTNAQSAGEFFTIAYRSSACESGRDEDGAVSGTIRREFTPRAGAHSHYVHGINCDLVSGNNL